jgi:hypothetical protein
MSFFARLKLELAVVHHSAHRWLSVRYNFYQIKTRFIRHMLSFAETHHTRLLAGCVNQANFTCLY